MTFFKVGRNLNAIFAFYIMMQLVVYIISYPLLWLFSKLPMRALYGVSDVLFLILYYVIGYRKKIVRYNLRLSFPERTESELRRIEKETLRHFVDVFMEMIKSFSITEKELKKRVILTNPELPDAYFEKDQSIILVSGHYANWEWVSSTVETSIKYNLSVAYKKISNEYFDRLIKKKRNQFGVTVVPTKEFYGYILNSLKNKRYQAYGFIADQSPKLKQIKYWGTFMGIEVPVINGPEVIARKLDLPVIYFHTERIKRGFYKSSFVLLEENSKESKLNQITNKFILELEKQIRKNPEYYFWTHKRFKHMKKTSV